MVRSFYSFLLIGALMTGTSAVSADDSSEVDEFNHPWINNDFIVWAGGYTPRKTVKLAAEAEGSIDNGDPVEIDFSDSLKAKDKESVANLGFYWRFGKKWWFSTEYYRTETEDSASIDEDLEWNGYTFLAGSSVAGGFSSDIYRITLGRDFLDRPNMDFSLGLGIHWIELGAFLAGNATVTDGEGSGQESAFRRENVSASAPLPNLSAWYLYAFSPKWLLEARLDWLSASFKEYSGRIINANIGVHYQVSNHFGVGLSYKHFGIDVDVDDESWYGSANVRHQGPFINLTGTW